MKATDRILEIRDHITDKVYYTDSLGLRDLLESLYALDEEGVVPAIDAVCNDPYGNSSDWAEAFLQIGISWEDNDE